MNFPGNLSLFSRYSFSWFTDIILLGRTKQLQFEDLHKLPQEYKSRTNYDEFKYILKSLLENEGCCLNGSTLGYAFYKSIFHKFWIGGVFRFLNDVLVLVFPLLIRRMVISAENKDDSSIFMYAILIFISSMFQALLLQQFIDYCFNCGQKVTSAAISLVFYSSLTYKVHLSNPKKTEGEDASSLRDFVVFAHNLWACPLLALGCIIMLLDILGFAGIASVLLLSVLVPIETQISKMAKRYRKSVLEYSDSRMSLVHDVVDGIRTLKLTNLCQALFDQIMSRRDKELNIAWKGMRLEILNDILTQSASAIVSLFTFAVYIWIYGSNTLTADKVFATLAIINILGRPIKVIPKCISLTSEGLVSLDRIALLVAVNPDFSSKDALNKSVVTELANNVAIAKIEVKNVTMKWSSSPNPVLDHISLNVQCPGLIFVIGSNSSGKSTLLDTIMGEHILLGTKASIDISTNRGVIAYCGHEPWILNNTVVYNILVGSVYYTDFAEIPTTIEELSDAEKCRLLNIITLCELETDVSTWPSGLNTMIGEKGINISGGQKARISLARAAFSNAKIFILDSPLAGLDIHVANQVFHKLISPLSKTSLVLMTTHDSSFLKYGDRILMLESGKLVFDGNFSRFNEANINMNMFGVSLLQNSTKSSSVVIADKAHGSNDSNKLASAVPHRSISKTTVKSDISGSGNQSWRVYLEYARACGFILALFALLASLCAYAIATLSDLVLAHWTDRKSDGYNKANYSFVNYSLMAALIVAMNTLRYIVYAKAGLRASWRLYEDLTASVLSAKFSFFDSISSGQLYSRFSSDFDSIDFSIPDGIVAAVDAILGVVSSILLIASILPIMLLALLPLAYLYLYVQKMYRTCSVELKRIDSGCKSPIFSQFREVLAGLKTIRGYKVESSIIRTHHLLLDRSIRARLNWDAGNRWLGIRVDIVGALIISTSAFFVAYYRTSFTGGLAGLIMSYSLKATNTLSFAIRSTTVLENMFTSTERVVQFLNIEKEDATICFKTRPDQSTAVIQKRPFFHLNDLVYSPLNSSEDYDNIEYSNAIELSTSDSSNPILEAVQLKVSYGTDISCPDILHGVSIALFPGKLIGICGRTGSGKSTLAYALARALNNSRYDVDDAIKLFGSSVSSMSISKYREIVQLFPQDYYIFSGTVRQAIDPMECYSDLVLNETLSQLASSKIHGDKESISLSHEITGGGSNLSAGQKQVIAFARAILSEAKVIILDEFNSNMDAEVTTKAFAILKSQLTSRGRCVLMICHILDDIFRCDELLVMSRGLIVEQGSPDKLQTDVNGLFSSMVHLHNDH